MAKIVTYGVNILEGATLTVTPTTDTDYPAYRLYDRKIHRNFKPGSLATTTIIIDQVGEGQEVDTIIIPSGHNLDGLGITVNYSGENSNYLEADSWVQSGSGVIQRTFTGQTKRYWKVVITSPTAIPSFAELFLTKAYTWDIQPESLDREDYSIFNIQRFEDTGGRPHYIEFGDKKEFRGYELSWIGDINSGTMWTEINALNAAWAGKKPFWMKDPDATVLFGELTERLEFRRSGDYRNCIFRFMEIVA